MIKGIATTTALSYTQVVYILKDFAGTYMEKELWVYEKN